MHRTLLFLCPHNAAKSVLAAAYCQHLLAQRGIEVQVASAGTEPDAAVSPEVVALLRREGLDVAHYRPQHVTREALETAFRVISLGCDVSHLTLPGTVVEHWDDVPAPSQQLLQARDAIYTHVERLVEALTQEGKEEMDSHLRVRDCSITSADRRQGAIGVRRGKAYDAREVSHEKACDVR